jgi:hypothetical protein
MQDSPSVGKCHVGSAKVADAESWTLPRLVAREKRNGAPITRYS